jgi:hypothetical protein
MEDSSPARDGAGSAPARGAGGRNGNNNRNGGRFGRGGGRGNQPHTNNFKGADPKLGFVFDVVSRGIDNLPFEKCLKAVLLFVGSTFPKYNSEIMIAVTTSNVAIKIWDRADKDFHDRTEVYSSFKSTLCSTVLGQCTEAMESKVKAHPDYAAAERDGILILLIIRDIMNNCEPFRNNSDAIHDVLQKFYTLKKERHETLQHYHERLTALCAVMERVGCTQDVSGIVREIAADADNPTDAERAAAFDKIKALQFIKGAGFTTCNVRRHEQLPN